MDLKLHVDFCFSCPGGRVVAAGWSQDPRPALMIHAGSASLPPAHLVRFARRDLRSLEPFGYLAVFDLSDHPDALDDPSEDVFLAVGAEHSRIGGARLSSDARSMVEIGVDEAFFALLRLMAEGAVPMPDRALSGPVITRIRAARALPAEAETHALSVDLGQVAGAGQGVASGWFLPTAATQGALHALAFDDRQLARVTMAQGAVARTDLAAYADRYVYGGRDGWLAAFRFAGPASGAARLLVMLPEQLAESGVIHPLTQVTVPQIARLLVEARLWQEDPEGADALHRATLAAPGAPAIALPDSPPLPDDAPLLLILDHDLAAPDLRDVLRRVAQATGRGIDLHLLRPTLTPDLRDAIAGAARECPQPVRIVACTPQPPIAAQGPALLVYARSSVLFHLAGRLPVRGEVPGHDLQVLALDVLASLPGGAGRIAARFGTDRPAFLCWGDAAGLLPALAPLLGDALVPESAFRQLAAQMDAAGRLAILPADPTGFHAGDQGPFAAPLFDSLTGHDFDALSARLVQEDAR
ncbi:hypothetical protein E4191_16370 (plasmid) [Paracoccus liaowanqingii]|uniref:Uncharacterized protein n=1 Tax=Paracoccus liaowanqingii TaxID=2560053 RepID=A0A4Y5SRZ8_9RHOB|nr:hypothetical protein [Paracoccus liaowanqingii]QDA35738.1 hypothetical protein E4191_16370 [Paracoccus liaowanqingii]